MSWDRVESLIINLPRNSRHSEKMNPELRWGDSEYMQAVVIDLLAGANWQRQNQGAKKNKQTPVPKPFWRPGKEDKEVIKRRSMRDKLLEQQKRLNIKRRGS